MSMRMARIFLIKNQSCLGTARADLAGSEGRWSEVSSPFSEEASVTFICLVVIP